jgi:hypothetical protein
MSLIQTISWPAAGAATPADRRYIEDNPGLIIPEALSQLQGLTAHDYEATATAAAPPAAAAAAAAAGSAQPAPRASFDQQPLSAVPLPNIAGLNLGGAGAGEGAGGGPPALRMGAMGGPPPLRGMGPGGAGKPAAAAAAAPAGHHQEFLTDPARKAEQQDK